MELALLHAELAAKDGEIATVLASAEASDQGIDEEVRALRTRLIEMCAERNAAVVTTREAKLRCEQAERDKALAEAAKQEVKEKSAVQMEAMSSMPAWVIVIN